MAKFAEQSGLDMLSFVIVEDCQSPSAIAEPDAHGQAALLLTESLIHLLVDKAALTNMEAIEVIQIAQEVKMQIATAAGESERRIGESLDLLIKMSASFESDS